MQEVLNHSVTVCLIAFGLHVRLGRSAPTAVNDTSTGSNTVNGVPDWTVTIKLVSQPLARKPEMPVRFCPKGNWYKPERTKLFRMSKRDRPYSSARLKGFSGWFMLPALVPELML